MGLKRGWTTPIRPIRAHIRCINPFGHMAELADALDLGSSGETRKSSSLFMPTNKTKNHLIFGNL